MKSFKYSALGLALFLGSCATAYRTSTPDDVYYSPSSQSLPQEQPTTSSGQVLSTGDNSGSGNYITYEDGSSPSGTYHTSGNYYTQQLMMFDNPYGFSYSPSLWADPYFGYNPMLDPFNPYMMDPYYGYGNLGYGGFGYGGLGYGGMGYGGMGYGGLSFGFGGGYFNNPFYYDPMYNPYYDPWNYNPYYYPGIEIGKYGNYTPRPSSTWAPRRSYYSPTANAGLPGNTARTGNPVRVFAPGTGIVSPNQPRRVFNQPVRPNYFTQGSGMSRNPNIGVRRVFTQSPNERPVYMGNPSNNNFRNNSGISNPGFRPTNSQPRTFQQPTFRSAPSPSFNSGGGSPRTFNPRR